MAAIVMPHLSFAQDLLSLVIGCIVWTFVFDRATLFVSGIGGVLLAGLSWVGCTGYVRLWNRKYHLTIRHHLLCGAAAVMSFFFALTFGLLVHMDQVAKLSVETWRLELNLETALDWKGAVFKKVYDELRSLGVEDLTNVLPPARRGEFIPLKTQESREAMAYIWAREAVDNFRSHRPFISKVLSAKEDVPRKAINEDVREFFQMPGNTIYSSDRAMDLASSLIKEQLVRQAPRTAVQFRMVLVGLFLLVVSISYLIAGFAAYRELKVFTATEMQFG